MPLEGSAPGTLSIGLPVYNGDRFLEEAINALLAQTFASFELIISDNASTDGTEAIGRAAAERDPRVRYNRNRTNIGLAHNYNALFEMTAAQYFKWSAADDVCEPTYLQECIDVLEQSPSVVLAYGRARFIDEAGKSLQIEDSGFDLRSEDPTERLKYVIAADRWVNATQGVIRSDALRKTRLHPRYPGGDFVLLGELSVQGRFVEIPRPLLRRRIHSEASSQLTGDRERLRHHVTGASQPGGAPAWSRLVGHLRTILLGELRVHQKFALLGALMSRMLRQRERLFDELKYALCAGGGRLRNFRVS